MSRATPLSRATHPAHRSGAPPCRVCFLLRGDLHGSVFAAEWLIFCRDWLRQNCQVGKDDDDDGDGGGDDAKSRGSASGSLNVEPTQRRDALAYDEGYVEFEAAGEHGQSPAPPLGSATGTPAPAPPHPRKTGRIVVLAILSRLRRSGRVAGSTCPTRRR